MKAIVGYCLIAAALVTMLWLTGCTFIAGVGGAISIGKEIYGDANEFEADVKPLRQIICVDELKKPHTPTFTAAVQTYCAEVPNTLLTAVKADYDMARAYEVEKAKQKLIP